MDATAYCVHFIFLHIEHSAGQKYGRRPPLTLTAVRNMNMCETTYFLLHLEENNFIEGEACKPRPQFADVDTLPASSIVQLPLVDDNFDS